MNIFMFYLLARSCVRDRHPGALRWKISEEYRVELPVAKEYLCTLMILGCAILLDSFSLTGLWYFIMFLGVGEYGMQDAWAVHHKDTRYEVSSDQILACLIPFVILLAPSVQQLLLPLLAVVLIHPPDVDGGEKEE